MLPFLPVFPIAQVVTLPPNSRPPAVASILPPQETLPLQEDLQPQEILQRQEIVQPQEIRPLSGKLDEIPVFNSNSPEMVMTEGILLSTFPPQGKRVPSAHLNFAFQGRFDLFSHHISKASNPSETRSLFQGILLHNPGLQPVTVEILQAATYLTRPDALFVNLPPYIEDPLGTVYAGPGGRVVNDILRGRKQGNWTRSLVIPPRQSQMLMNLPIPAGSVTPTSNGRSTLMRLSSSHSIYVASLAMFAPRNPNGTERIPTLEEWQNLLDTGGLAGPRDRSPTPPSEKTDRIIYGRVAGVAQGSQWQAKLTDSPRSDRLTIPRKGRAISYGLSTLPQGTFGTGQVQSAPMLVRYPDTAYLANGNYGIQYNLTLPLHNDTKQTKTVALVVETPVKQDKGRDGLLFFTAPEPQIFFRGTVRLRYADDQGTPQIRYIHLVQRRGQQGEPLVTLTLKGGTQRSVEVDFLYPPDATPPQILTIKTLNN
ncbi:DUF3370 domain-containing protein [Phormidesmis sp. 146-35]